MSGSRQNEARCFSENSPRPPVPGEETGNYISRFRPQSPTLTPRRSSLATPTASGCDTSAPLGFEPEGCCNTATIESDSPPGCLRWARNLHSLLQDPVGLELFRKYLDQEGKPHANPLNFWFACEGLKGQSDPERILQLVKLIYRKFFLESQLAISEDVWKEANRRVEEGRADEKVFDGVQSEVERLINETTYPNFLRSDMYLQSTPYTDSSVDGTSMSKQRSKKQLIRQCKGIKDTASLNRDSLAHHGIIPRTQRAPRDLTHPLKPTEFAQVLIEKLENVKRERESQEKLDRHLQESEPINKDTLADALTEKLMIQEDNDQSILDQHVSRVWSDLTPSRSPGFSSSRLHSPERRRCSTHNYPRPYKQRKEKDVFSTFSADSGNIHDFQEGSDLVGAGSMTSLGSHLPKSKSVPSDYADSLHKQDLYLQGHDQRFKRSDMTRRSGTKKSMTELTDSGVSVVSYAPPSIFSKDTRLLLWLKETDKKADIKHSSRHGRKYGSLSGSLERTTRETWGVPAQPFVADPGMPPLPQPHTPTQLEEARRRLIEDRARQNCKQRHCNISKQSYEPTMQSQSYVQSNQSTLKKMKQDIGDFTTVVFHFCDEQFPYRMKIPGHNVTLKQFKEYLPKKGSYRYFFKTECEDLDTRVIQEEITDDSEVLPLWEGKVMAQVKALE